MKNIILVLLLVACTSTKQMMDSWVGQDKQTLIRTWGPPERTTSDGAKGEVLVYGKQYYNSYLHQTYYDCKMFYVNEAGLVYHWLSQRSAIPPQQVEVNLNRYNY